MITMQDFKTAIRCNTPITHIIFNNMYVINHKILKN